MILATSVAESTLQSRSASDSRSQKRGKTIGPEANHRDAQGFKALQCAPEYPAPISLRPTPPSSEFPRGLAISADSSNVSDAPWCTPPRPPVANTRIPARFARNEVAATVVAALLRCRREHRQIANAGLGHRLVGNTFDSRRIESDMWHAVQHRNSRRCHTCVAKNRLEFESRLRRLRGRGNPWEMIVDSSATTGRRSWIAVSTSSANRTLGDLNTDPPA